MTLATHLLGSFSFHTRIQSCVAFRCGFNQLQRHTWEKNGRHRQFVADTSQGCEAAVAPGIAAYGTYKQPWLLPHSR